MDESLANALPMPSAAIVAVTRGALLAPDESELRAVVAHELEHLGERGPMRLSRLTPLYGKLGLAALAAYLARESSFHDAVSTFRPSPCWRWSSGRGPPYWRRSEDRSDAAGFEHDEWTYASALIRLYRYSLARRCARCSTEPADGRACVPS